MPMNIFRAQLLLPCIMFVMSNSYCEVAQQKQEIMPENVQLMQELANIEKNSVQSTVVATFLAMVENYISIIQNPENAELISDNVAETMSQLVNAAAQIMQNIPPNATEAQKKEYIETLEEALMVGIRTIITDK